MDMISNRASGDNR